MRNVLCSLVLFVCACSSKASKAEDPDRRPTRAECTAGVDHAIALLAGGPFGQQMRETREQAIAQCVSVATLRDHQCLMKSKTADELGLCPMPGTGGAR